MSQPARWIASAWILFHLLAIAMLPNAASILNADLRSVVVPYANLLGFHSFWQFFSPDPGAAVFLRTRAMKQGTPFSTEDYPPPVDPFWIRSQYNRRVASVRFFSRPPSVGIGRYFGPYLCRANPEADSLDIALVVMRPSTPDEVRFGSPLNSLEHEQAQGSELVSCNRGATP